MTSLALRGAREVESAPSLARDLADLRPVPGDGQTGDLWEALATIASVDLGAARAIEPHLDAAAIFVQSGAELPPGTWGVFASEGGDDPLVAVNQREQWSLSGTKEWCSLAGELDLALVTARTAGGQRMVFAVDLADGEVMRDSPCTPSGCRRDRGSGSGESLSPGR